MLVQDPVDVIEGSWPGAVVLMQFPSRKAATTWHNSAEYRGILPLRTGNAIADLILVDELPESFTVKVSRPKSAAPWQAAEWRTSA
jgi:hypothetical protein